MSNALGFPARGRPIRSAVGPPSIGGSPARAGSLVAPWHTGAVHARARWKCRVGRAEPNATASGDQGLADGRCRMPPQRVVRIGRFVGKHVAAIHGKVCHGTPGFWTKRVYIHARSVGFRPVVEAADHRAADARTSSSP
jgi:hypothetical protein